MSHGGIPLEEWSGAGATKDLHVTIKKFVEASEKQSKHMIRLTWFIAFLTIIMVIEVAFQIWPLAS